MKSFKEDIINPEGFDLTNFNILIKSPDNNLVESDGDFNTIIKTNDIKNDATVFENKIITINETEISKTISVSSETNPDDKVLLEIINPVIPSGNDGYTPIKGKDYVDGKDGYTPIKGKDYFDGETPIKGKDYVDGKDGYTPIKGKDYVDGKDGLNGTVPKHEIDTRGNIRFETPEGVWGEWIEIENIITRLISHYTSRPTINTMYGGGDILNFIYGDTICQAPKSIIIDSDMFILSQMGSSVLLQINPQYISNTENNNSSVYRDIFQLNVFDSFTLTLTHSPLMYTETVTLNGQVLTYGLDYEIHNKLLIINEEHQTGLGAVVSVRYSFGIGNIYQ